MNEEIFTSGVFFSEFSEYSKLLQSFKSIAFSRKNYHENSSKLNTVRSRLKSI